MRYASIKLADCANGTGVRTCLFVSGCTHHCEGCFNPDTWDFQYGKPYTPETERDILQSMNNPYTDGLTILGGEPMEIVNQEGIVSLVQRTKQMGKTVWIYSGYRWEELTDPSCRRCHGPHTEEILRNTDILVDGEFHLAEKDITLKFRGSANQRIIDVQGTLQRGQITCQLPTN